MTVRRAPKLAPFVILGIAVGLLGSLIATTVLPVDPNVGFAALAGYFSLYGVSFGLVAGLAVWLVLDWRSKRKSRDVTVSRESS